MVVFPAYVCCVMVVWVAATVVRRKREMMVTADQ